MHDAAAAIVGPGLVRDGQPKWSPRWDYAAVIALFLASRAFLIATGCLAARFMPLPYDGQTILPDLFVRWDSLWYIHLAQSGYSIAEPITQTGAANLNFFPAYPALIWLTSHLTGLSAAAAGVTISNLAFLAALLVIYALGRQLGGSRSNALISVMLIAFVPEGFVFSAVYTESLFVLVTAGAMLTYSRGHYVAASALSAVGSSVRANGVLIAVWYGLEILRKRGWRGAFRFWERPEEYLPLLAAPFGLLAFWWFCYFYTGDAFAQKSTVTFGWGWIPTWPWNGIVTGLRQGNFEDRFWIISGLVSLALSFTLLRKGQWTLFAYCAINFALFFSTSLPNSFLRYSISLIPIYFGLSYYIRGHWALAAVVFLLFGGMLMIGWERGAVVTI